MGQIMNCAIPVCCPANSPPPPTIVFLPTPAIHSSCCTHRCMLSLSDCPACTATRANGSSAPCLSWLLVTIRRRVSTVANPATIPRIRALAVTVYLQPGRRGSRWLLLLSVIYNLYHAAIHFGEGEFIIFPALPHTALPDIVVLVVVIARHNKLSCYNSFDDPRALRWCSSNSSVVALHHGTPSQEDPFIVIAQSLVAELLNKSFQRFAAICVKCNI